MKTISILSSLALAAAVNAQGFFSTLNLRSASPIHFTTLSASDYHIWIGKPTTSYCPPVAMRGGVCPNSTETNFAGGNGTLTMGAIVAGGQQVYIDPSCGALAYTHAHSSFLPQGAITTGFTNDPVPDRSYNFLEWNGNDFVACPTNATSHVYQVFVPLESVTLPDDCLGFQVTTEAETSADAWQYD